MPHLARKLSLLNAAVRDLASAGEGRALAERMLDVIETVFGRPTAAVLWRNERDGTLRIAASRGYEPEVVAAYRARPGEGVAGSVLAGGEPRLVTDVTAEPDYVAGVSEAVSEMAVPLLVDGEVVGVLDVESRALAFTEEDMALLCAFGEQAAWAVRHGAALDQARRRAHRLELLNRAARAVNTVHDPEELLSQILTLCHEALGFRNAAVLVPNRRAQHLVVRKALRDASIQGLKIPLDQGITGAVFGSGQPEIVPDINRDSRYISGGSREVGSEIVAPLRLNGEVIGVLDAEAPQTNAFSELDLEVFSTFASHVATALRTAQMVSALEDRARRLEGITRSGRALGRVLDPDEILHEILEGVSTALGLERAAILLLDIEEHQLVMHAARGYENVVGARIPLGRGVTGRVAQTGEPVLVHDISSDPRYLPGIEGGASEMAVPLRVQNELFGVLDSESPKPWAFNDRDLELFQAFADQAAVALYNARLFQQLEFSNRRLTRNIGEMSRLNSKLESYAGRIASVNENLEQQVHQLHTLHEAGRTITASLDLDHTLETILRMTGELVTSSAGAIRLLDQDTSQWREVAHTGEVPPDGEQVTVDVPLKIGERTIGVFELVRSKDAGLDEGDQRMLETLASQAAIAIENSRLFEDTQRVYYDTLTSLARALEARDDYTRGHSERVARLSLAMARQMGLSDDECQRIRDAALLHDIGKIGIRDAVLLKPRKLSDEERAVIQRHPAVGNLILGPLTFLGEVSVLVKHHHERWDGDGYPNGLQGEQIPLPSRIISVADTYDAMTSDRPYRDALSHQEAMDEIRRCAGGQLDPTVVEIFIHTMQLPGFCSHREAGVGTPHHQPQPRQ